MTMSGISLVLPITPEYELIPANYKIGIHLLTLHAQDWIIVIIQQTKVIHRYLLYVL